MGEAEEYLCVSCATHYDAATKWAGLTECKLMVHGEYRAMTRGELTATDKLEDVTCCSCKRSRELRMYLAELMDRDWAVSP